MAEQTLGAPHSPDALGCRHYPGLGFKIAAAHTFTIGYDDYTVDKETKLVDLNNLQLPDPNEPLPAEKNSGPMCIEQ